MKKKLLAAALLLAVESVQSIGLTEAQVREEAKSFNSIINEKFNKIRPLLSQGEKDFLSFTIFRNCTFSDLDFSGVTFQTCQFIDCSFYNVNFSRTNFVNRTMFISQSPSATYPAASLFLGTTTFKDAQFHALPGFIVFPGGQRFMISDQVATELSQGAAKPTFHIFTTQKEIQDFQSYFAVYRFNGNTEIAATNYWNNFVKSSLPAAVFLENGVQGVPQVREEMLLFDTQRSAK